VAVIWCGAVGLDHVGHFPWHFANGQWSVQNDAVFRYFIEGSLAMVLPPLLVYALGGALFWAFRALWERSRAPTTDSGLTETPHGDAPKRGLHFGRGLIRLWATLCVLWLLGCGAMY